MNENIFVPNFGNGQITIHFGLKENGRTFC